MLIDNIVKMKQPRVIIYLFDQEVTSLETSVVKACAYRGVGDLYIKKAEEDTSAYIKPTERGEFIQF